MGQLVLPTIAIHMSSNVSHLKNLRLGFMASWYSHPILEGGSVVSRKVDLTSGEPIHSNWIPLH